MVHHKGKPEFSSQTKVLGYQLSCFQTTNFIKETDFSNPNSCIPEVFALTRRQRNGQAHSNISLGLSLTVATDNLTEDGELLLNDQSGRQIWIRPESGGSGTAYAPMLDTGNFLVASQVGANLWQSFDEPTDTLLPTQNLNLGAQLIAPYQEKNYSDGRFKFILQADGNLLLYTTRYPTTTSNVAYWSTQSSIGSGYRVVFNQSGYMYLVARWHHA
ncbi:hypothetical protein POTOM_012878 [Populus tomentosa]|uniref:Bulb-type lectin domain-containing protein n=1 Tax=Populus tomentosa TaxID=118781 RepID=A0A8X8ALX3_POPTO|nr:hypothetical protein POTOM_012878 [Populus tomentosa]